MPPKESGSIAIPGWFVRVVTASAVALTTIAGAAIPWAWSIDKTMVRIETRLDGLNDMWSSQIAELKRRVEKLER